MIGKYLIGSNEPSRESNIFANKSALVLRWLLESGTKEKEFSLREVALECEVSVGLVQKIFGALLLRGILQTHGIRTKKSFFLKKPSLLLKTWLENYSVLKKCKMWTYSSAFQGKKELLEALKKSGLNKEVLFALHSSAEAHGYKNTNLGTLELYMMNPNVRSKLEAALQLKPQEKGYEVLLINPYYKSLLDAASSNKAVMNCPSLLTFLDLYHFPLRGQEQAEFMAEKIPELKRLYR